MREFEIPFSNINESHLGFYYKYTSKQAYVGLEFVTYTLITGIRMGRNSEGVVKQITLNPDEKTETTLFDIYTDFITLARKD